MTELEAYIKSYFGIVEAHELQAIVALFKLTPIKKREFLLKTGKPCDTLSFVQSGILRVFVTTPDKEVTQWISTQNYFSTDLSSFVFHSPLDNSISHNNQKVSNLRLETMLRFEKDFSKKVKRERFCSFLQHFLSKLGKFCERTHPSNYQQKAMPRR